MTKQKTICALYTRVSTRNQLREEYNSLETQRERLELYCKSQEDSEIFRVYEDGAYSAETLDRPALQEMLKDMRAGRFNCVLAYKIDRLTRSVKDFHSLMDLFDKFNVQFVSITQSIDTKSPTGRLLRNILLDFAQFEREMTGDRTRDKLQQRAQKGLWNGGIPSYGYAAENKRLVLNTEEASRVKFIFARFAETPSLAKLRDEFKSRGWLTRYGKPWGKTSFDNILRNPIYCGTVGFNGQRYQGAHEPIISEELFKRVQSLRRVQTHSKTRLYRNYLLRGMLKCGDCGSYMTPVYALKRRKNGETYRIPYYRCSKTMHFTNEICSNKNINANLIEGLVLKDVAELSRNEDLLNISIDRMNQDLKERVRPLEQEIKDTEKRLGEIDGEIGNYVQALGKGKISVERLEQEIDQRQKEQEALKLRQEELHRQINREATQDLDVELVKSTLQDFNKVFESLTPQEQSEALQCVLKDVTLYPDKVVLNIFELPGFKAGSQNRTNWLPRQDSNLQPSG